MADVIVNKNGEIILIWLHRNDKTQQWLAGQLGITRQTLSKKIKENLFSGPEIATLKRLNILTL